MKIDAYRTAGVIIIAAAAILVLYEFAVRKPLAPTSCELQLPDINDSQNGGEDGGEEPRYAGPACCPRPANEAARRADSLAKSVGAQIKINAADTSLEDIVFPDGP